jgi:transcription-repair coupling factor (superfamily II helicase)
LSAWKYGFDLDNILHMLAENERVEALAIALRERPGARLHAAPALGAARPALVAALAARGDQPIVYVVGSGDAALRAREDLCQWLDPSALLLFPAGDALPYEPMSPGNDVIAGRLRVLQKIRDWRLEIGDSEGNRQSLISNLKVVVAPIKALLQPTLAPTEYAEASVRLRRGDEHNLDELMARWTAMGYRAAPTVEEPGELNRRGGIIDIFPPGDELPLRIEFFGDEVDSLRRFDPISQRSEAQIREVVIGPPHEIALWRTAEAVERMRALDAAGLRREARDEWEATIERIENGERFEGRALYAPFFWEPTDDEAAGRWGDGATGDNDRAHSPTRPLAPASLLAHLAPGTPVIFGEMALLAQHVSEVHHHAEERRARHTESGELPPGFPRPYLLWDELIEQAAKLSLVNLSNNDSEIRDWRLEIRDAGGNLQSPISNLRLPETLFAPADLFGGQLKRLVEDIVGRLRDGEQVAVVTPQAARIQEMVEEALKGDGATRRRGAEATGRRSDGAKKDEDDRPLARSESHPLFMVVHGSLDEGWRSPNLNLTLYSDTEIFGWRQRRPVAERKRKRDRSAEERAAFLRGLKVGDYVVHIEHGIAVYEGLIRRTIGKTEREYLNLRYAEGDRLYVPVDQIDRVSRYIGAGDAAPQLTRLGTQDWERAKRKARAAVQELANDLLELYAKRQLSQGHAFSPDSEWQRELEDAFPSSRRWRCFRRSRACVPIGRAIRWPRSRSISGNPCAPPLFPVQREFEQPEAAAVERRRRLVVHLVGGDLHHLLLEADRIAAGADLKAALAVDPESAAVAGFVAGQVMRVGAGQREPGRRLGRRFVECQRCQVARAEVRRVGVGDIFREQALALLVPLHTGAQHGKDRDVGNGHESPAKPTNSSNSPGRLCRAHG